MSEQIGCARSRFLNRITNDGLIDCHSSQAIRFKRAEQVENSYFCSLGLLALIYATAKSLSLVLYFTWVYASFHPSHSDNAGNVILLRKHIDEWLLPYLLVSGCGALWCANYNYNTCSSWFRDLLARIHFRTYMELIGSMTIPLHFAPSYPCSSFMDSSRLEINTKDACRKCTPHKLTVWWRLA